MATEKKNTNNGAKVMACTCTHAFQDREHGAAMRVHNGCANGWRCTVCTKVK